jgi:hypothetical protein
LGVKPNPFFVAGLVATFQNSAQFWGVPFGYNYVDRKPSPVQFGECSLTGVFLKTNNNCAVIDLDNQSGLRRYTSFYVSTNDAFLGKRRYVVFI